MMMTTTATYRGMRYFEVLDKYDEDDWRQQQRQADSRPSTTYAADLRLRHRHQSVAYC